MGERTALLNPDTQETIELGDHFGSVRLSPDRSRLVGLLYGDNPTLGTLDLSTQAVQTYDTAMTPDQVAWSSTSAEVFYTVREARDEALPMTPEEQEVVNRSFGVPGEVFAFPEYTVQIHQLTLMTGADTTLYSAPVNTASIGRLFINRQHTLIFSQIPNLQDWIAAMAAGRFDPSSPADSTALQLATVPVTVLNLNLGTADLLTIGSNVNLFAPKEMSSQG